MAERDLFCFSHLDLLTQIRILDFLDLNDLLSCRSVSKVTMEACHNAPLLWSASLHPVRRLVGHRFGVLSLAWMTHPNAKDIMHTNQKKRGKVGGTTFEELVSSPSSTTDKLDGVSVNESKEDKCEGETERKIVTPCNLFSSAMLWSGSSGNAIRFWDMETGSCLRDFVGHGGAIGAMCITPLRTQWAIGLQNKISSLDRKDTQVPIEPIEVLCGSSSDTSCPRKPYRLAAPESHVSKDDEQMSMTRIALFTASDDKNIGVWDAESGDRLLLLCRHTNMILTLAVCESRGLLFSGGWERVILVWNLENWECVRQIPINTEIVLSLTIVECTWINNSSNYGEVESHPTLVFASSHSDTMNAWLLSDASVLDEANEIRHVLKQDNIHTTSVVKLCWSPLHQLLCTGGGDYHIKLWKILQTTGEDAEQKSSLTKSENSQVATFSLVPYSTLQGHQRTVLDLSLCCKEAILASSSSDFSIRLWRLPCGSNLRVISDHSNKVSAITSFCIPSQTRNVLSQISEADNRNVEGIISGSDDKHIIVWVSRFQEPSTVGKAEISEPRFQIRQKR